MMYNYITRQHSRNYWGILLGILAFDISQITHALEILCSQGALASQQSNKSHAKQQPLHNCQEEAQTPQDNPHQQKAIPTSLQTTRPRPIPRTPISPPTVHSSSIPSTGLSSSSTIFEAGNKQIRPSHDPN